MTKTNEIRTLINRLTRLDAAEGWNDDLNPTQRDALDYLAKANQFSRSPSHVANYLGTTRGTMSQTLKSLTQKSYLKERRSQIDKRSIAYELTEKGMEVVEHPHLILRALDQCSTDMLDQLGTSLLQVLRHAINGNKGRSFGMCNTCDYYKVEKNGGYCRLLSVALKPFETTQICHEHTEQKND